MNRFRIRSGSGVALTALICGTCASAALAQVPPAAVEATPSDTAASGDILVTARKREERLQDVPISVAVVDAGAIARNGVRSLADVAKLTPGFQYSTAFGPNDVRPVLRGISTVRGRPSVAILEDGFDTNGAALATAGGSSLMNVRLLDLERVEVVRGPQSATYGRNAFAGAIN